jgi:hypothetical protein
LSTAERTLADDGLNPANDEVLKLKGAGKCRVVAREIARVMAERGKPSPSAIVVLTPGDRVKGAVTGVTTHH